jgi:glutamyl-tRNA reductase
VGEPQILGQFKDAVRTARRLDAGSGAEQAVPADFSVAKSVRSETEIGTATVSMAAAAVNIAQRIYPSIRSKACSSSVLAR